MPKFVVLLRGVNVGKGNRVPMAEFKLALEDRGCTQVKTLLNSGNAVFCSADGSVQKHAQEIAAAVLAKFGVSVPVVVKSAGEFAAIVDGNPMAPQEADHSRFLVAFASHESALQALHPLSALAQPNERLVIAPQAAYLHCPGGLLDSKIGSALLGKPGKAVTSRNWATVLKLAELLV